MLGLTNKKALARQKLTNEGAHDTGTNQCESFDRQKLNIRDVYCSTQAARKAPMRSALANRYQPMRMPGCPKLTNESGLMVGRGGGHGLLVGLVKSPDLVLLAVEDPAFPSAEVHQVPSHSRGVEQRICSTRIELGQFGEIKMFELFQEGPDFVIRALICKPCKGPRNRFPAWRAGTTTLFVPPARQTI